MSTEKKDLLPYIHVYCGPKDDGTVYLLATDAGKGMQISQFRSTSFGSGWIAKAVADFAQWVDPRTLEVLSKSGGGLRELLHMGEGSIWITPDKVVVRQLADNPA
jgi:hypothetical protein